MRYVFEFLYRGPQPHNGGQSAWHVVLAEDVPVMGGIQTYTSDAMTPAKAMENGFSLEAILGEIAARAISEKEAAEAARDIAIAERDEARQKLGETTATVALQAETIRALTPEPEAGTKSTKKSTK